MIVSARCVGSTERGIADAVIISDTQSADPRVDYLAKLRKPFVTFGRTRAAARHAWVDPDFEAAVEDAVAHLVELGHRRIGLALPELHTNYVDLIEAGYRRAMRARGFPVDEGWDIRRPASERGGIEAADALLANDPRPTAVLVTNAMHAVALYRRLNEFGLRPGRDISVLGLLPEARAEYLIPTLTTYQTNWTEIGRRLGDAVVSEIARASAEREAQDAGAAKVPHERIQLKMPVEFSPEKAFTALAPLADGAAVRRRLSICFKSHGPHPRGPFDQAREARTSRKSPRIARRRPPPLAQPTSLRQVQALEFR